MPNRPAKKQAFASDGKLYVSEGTSIWVCEPPEYWSRRLFARVETSAGALAIAPFGDLLGH
ncbi:hypothetical protein ACVINW_004023 [Bradyrhizobium sp. USDA 4461]